MGIENTALNPPPVHCQVLPLANLHGTTTAGPTQAWGRVPKWLPVFNVKILDHLDFEEPVFIHLLAFKFFLIYLLSVHFFADYFIFFFPNVLNTSHSIFLS